MQHIVVRTAKPANLVARDWRTNASGRNVSHSFGYGLMDAGAMIAMARKWVSMPAQYTCEVRSPQMDKLVPSKGYIELKLRAECSNVRFLEHVQSKVTLSATRRGDIHIYLVSPHGTRSTLLAQRPADVSDQGFRSWPFMTVHNWGESPNGIWTLEIHNEGKQHSRAHLREWTLILFGTHDDPNKHLDGARSANLHRQFSHASLNSVRPSPQQQQAISGDQSTSSAQLRAQPPPPTYSASGGAREPLSVPQQTPAATGARVATSLASSRSYVQNSNQLLAKPSAGQTPKAALPAPISSARPAGVAAQAEPSKSLNASAESEPQLRPTTSTNAVEAVQLIPIADSSARPQQQHKQAASSTTTRVPNSGQAAVASAAPSLRERQNAQTLEGSNVQQDARAQLAATGNATGSAEHLSNMIDSSKLSKDYRSSGNSAFNAATSSDVAVISKQTTTASNNANDTASGKHQKLQQQLSELNWQLNTQKSSAGRRAKVAPIVALLCALSLLTYNQMWAGSFELRKPQRA